MEDEKAIVLNLEEKVGSLISATSDPQLATQLMQMTKRYTDITTHIQVSVTIIHYPPTGQCLYHPLPMYRSVSLSSTTHLQVNVTTNFPHIGQCQSLPTYRSVSLSSTTHLQVNDTIIHYPCIGQCHYHPLPMYRSVSLSSTTHI